MARLFDDASSQFLSNANAVVAAHPFTMGCWFNVDDDTQDLVLMDIADSATANNEHALIFQGDVAGDLIRAMSRAGGTFAFSESASAALANTFNHALGIWASTTSRVVYLNGVAGVESTTARDPNALLDRTSIGRFGDSTPSSFMSGMIAEAAIWNVALSQAEITLLANGYCPLFVRPNALLAYWPLIGRLSTEIDLVGRFDMTVSGAVQAAHPRIIYPSRQIVVPAAAIAPAGNRRRRVLMGAVA